MERIDHRDVDFYLQQIEATCTEKPVWEKKQEELRVLYGFTIWIPACFSPADQEAAEKIFWSEDSPEIFFLTERRTAGITIQAIEEKIQSAEIIQEQLIKMDSRIVCYDKGETEGIVKVQWVEYKSFAGDERVYNVLFFFPAGDRNILGTFFCLFEEYDRWKPMVWEMMQSIEESADERI